MARGQKKGWRAKPASAAKPSKPVRVETGIWLEPSGRYRAVIFRGSESVYLGIVATIEEARSLRVGATKAESAGLPRASRTDAKMSVEKFFPDVYVKESLADCKASTIRSARARFNSHILQPLGKLPISAVTYERCASFRAKLVERDDLSGQSKREVFRILRGMLDLAVKHGFIDGNPTSTLKNPKKRSKRIAVPDIAVVEAIIAHITHPVARMLAELLRMTGMRLNEALALTWNDVDLGEKAIRVERTIDQAAAGIVLTVPKTEAATRTVQIGKRLVALLKTYRKKHGVKAWVFPSDGERPFNDRNFQQRHWNPAMVKAKAPHITPHGLRHLYASVLLQQGAELLYIARQLGHTSASFTLAQYGHLLKASSPSTAVLDTAF